MAHNRKLAPHGNFASPLPGGHGSYLWASHAPSAGPCQHGFGGLGFRGSPSLEDPWPDFLEPATQCQCQVYSVQLSRPRIPTLWPARWRMLRKISSVHLFSLARPWMSSDKCDRLDLSSCSEFEQWHFYTSITSFIYLNFKFTIKFMGLTSSPVNLMVNLKLFVFWIQRSLPVKKERKSSATVIFKRESNAISFVWGGKLSRGDLCLYF